MRLQIMLTAGFFGLAAAAANPSSNNFNPEKIDIKQYAVMRREEDEQYVLSEEDQRKEIFPKPKYQDRRSNSLKGYASRISRGYRGRN